MRSSIDGTDQPSFFWRCNDHRDLPLLVGLHTWSTDRYNQVKSFYPLALKNRWHLLLFEFRGPNLNTNPRATEACASKIAMQGVIDAIEKIYYIAKVDKKHIFLIGGSGGAHMALMLAGYRPELWRSVASFCPITDLAPGIVKTRITLRTSKRAAVAHHVLKRLKNTEIVLLFFADSIAKCKQVYIYHGKFDRSVPFTHSLNIFKKICEIDPKANVFFEIFIGHEMIIERAETQFICAASKNSTITG